MLRAICVALALVALPAAASAAGVGACAFDRLPPAEREAVMKAYQSGGSAGMAALQARATALSAAGAACLGRSDAPPLWVHGAIGAHVIQAGAARYLLSAKGLSRARLESAWVQAPADARDCTVANAGKAFGAPVGVCKDKKSPGALLTALGLSSTAVTDRPAVAQALFYFNARAQGEIAEALLARFKAGERPLPAAVKPPAAPGGARSLPPR